MPHNTGTGVILSGFITLLGFGLIWHIWWLVVLCFIATVATAVAHSFDEHRNYDIPASEVTATEGKYFKQLAAKV